MCMFLIVLVSILTISSCRELRNCTHSDIFYEQADFGYLTFRLPKHKICQGYSELICSNQLTYCTGKNVYFDFSNLNIKKSTRYRDDVIGPGQVGGKCDKGFDEQLIRKNLNHPGYLTSWSDELQHFTNIQEEPLCDVTFEKPTILMKLDAAVNMYHHFCDFINLYASLHINQTFSEDVDIIWYDTHPDGFKDQLFGVTWKAFSNNTPIELKTLDQKKVCFKNLMLPLLARQHDGLFYNSRIVPECSRSELFTTFSEFILSRLQIPSHQAELENVRIVILSRSTSHRKILNVRELMRAAGQLKNVSVKVIDFNHKISFLNQLNTTSKADIFIGMHGAGLTHLLFLPPWATVFELYNCDDVDCYSDLARLKGVHYFTWDPKKIHLIEADSEGRHPGSGEKHKKFANYSFNVPEFVRIVRQMIDTVRRNPEFQNSRRLLKRKLRAKQKEL